MLRFITITVSLLLALVFSAPALGGEDVYWIDVRSASEYADGHVAGAVNIPHTEIAERIGEVTADKDATLYLYCRSGRRSGMALNALREAGYDGAVNVGGLDDALQAAAATADDD